MPGKLGGPAVWAMNEAQVEFRERLLDKLAHGVYRLEAVPACLCGSESSVPIATQDRFGLPIAVLACDRCSLARTSPRLRAEDLPAFYEHDYHGLHWGKPDPAPDTALFGRGQGTRIHEYVDGLLPETVRLAEIGCGTGQVLREFEAAARAAGRSVTAVGSELAPAYVEAGRSVGSELVLGSVEALGPYAPFDLVIMSHVLEHMTDPVEQLTQITGMLAPDGLIYVEVPGILEIHKKPEYDYELLKYLTIAHIFHFSLATLTDTATRAGLERVRGDESVRAIFRPGPGTDGASDTHRSADLIAYLRRLGTPLPTSSDLQNGG